MYSERVLFLNALMFYTRIPVPKKTPYSPEILNESRKYFTTIGIVVGVICSSAYLALHTLLANSVAILLSMIIGILLTGAFHEDGFADTCDAFGGGWQKEQVLTIMKDSRIGTYGTVALICILSLKFALLFQLSIVSPLLVCACLIAAHGSSRHLCSKIIGRFDYVQDTDQSKVKPIATAKLDSRSQRFSLLATGVSCLPLAYFSVSAIILGLILSYLVSELFIRYSKHRIGGYTGDVLGAVQQLTEVLFLIGCLIIV